MWALAGILFIKKASGCDLMITSTELALFVLSEHKVHMIVLCISSCAVCERLYSYHHMQLFIFITVVSLSLYYRLVIIHTDKFALCHRTLCQKDT